MALLAECLRTERGRNGKKRETGNWVLVWHRDIVAGTRRSTFFEGTRRRKFPLIKTGKTLLMGL